MEAEARPRKFRADPGMRFRADPGMKFRGEGRPRHKFRDDPGIRFRVGPGCGDQKKTLEAEARPIRGSTQVRGLGSTKI